MPGMVPLPMSSEERDRNIDDICQTIRNCVRAGIPSHSPLRHSVRRGLTRPAPTRRSCRSRSSVRQASQVATAGGIDVRCGGRLRLLALLEAGAVTVRILRYPGVPTEVPAARPARAPPLPGGDGAW
jgi:hypothetical protein